MNNKIKAGTGFLHKSKSQPHLWQGNFNYTSEDAPQMKCPMILIDLKSKIMCTLREKDEALVGFPEQIAQVIDDVPINKQGIIDTSAFMAGEFHEPVFRSASFAWFLYKNKNGTPYLYMVEDSKQEFGQQAKNRINSSLNRATAYSS